LEEGAFEDGAGGVVGVAGESGGLIVVAGKEKVLGPYLMTMSFVFGFTRAFSSSISGIHPFSGLAFQRSTSTPSDAGME